MNVATIKQSIAYHYLEIERLEYQLQHGSFEGFEPAFIQNVMNEVCKVFGITKETLCSSIKTNYLVNARAAFIQVARANGYRLHAIANFVNRDHSSVHNLLVDFEQRLRNYPEHAEKMLAVINQFKR